MARDLKALQSARAVPPLRQDHRPHEALDKSLASLMTDCDGPIRPGSQSCAIRLSSSCCGAQRHDQRQGAPSHSQPSAENRSAWTRRDQVMYFATVRLGDRPARAKLWYEPRPRSARPAQDTLSRALRSDRGSVPAIKKSAAPSSSATGAGAIFLAALNPPPPPLGSSHHSRRPPLRYHRAADVARPELQDKKCYE